MRTVIDDPFSPDPGFAELYGDLPDATDLWPWLELAQAAAGPVLYLGIGACRLAVPLHTAGVALVGVDSHPGMLARLRRRLPELRTVQSPIERLALEERFRLIMAPSNILYLVQRLRAAASHLDPTGVLALELANPHWLRAGAGDGVRVRQMDGNQARLEIDYRLPDRGIITQRAEVTLVWPEEMENWLQLGAGLKLQRMFGRRDEQLATSPSFYVVAGR
jgi:hypothetical protein